VNFRGKVAEETYDIVLGARVSKRINDKILAEQGRIAKLTGIRPSINEVVRMLIESGLDARRKR
jgi:hypothetical protein